MRFLFWLSIIVILSESAYSRCSTWTERMKKYGDLVHCKYYVTSEANYNHFIPYVIDNNNNITDPDSDYYLMSLRFYTLAKETIKVKLLTLNDSVQIDSFTEFTEYPIRSTTVDPYRYYTTSTRKYSTTSMSPITYAAKGRAETHKYDIGYEIVISAPQTFIRTDTKQIRTLSTPDIVRNDEPNEVFINIFKDGQLKVAVNGIEALHTRIEFANDLKFFSFASREDRQREEFFYDCV